MIETFILIIHIEFICIGIFINNYTIRIYFELVAFFGMLFCIFVDLSFSIILSIKAFCEIISKTNNEYKKNGLNSLSFKKFPHSKELQ